MTLRSISLATLLLVLPASRPADPPAQFALTEASTLWVTGTSTVHDWRCDAEQVEGWLEAEAGETLTAVTGAAISVQTEALSCKNGTMNKKTYGALQAKTYPAVRYELTTADVRPGSGTAFTVETTGRLTITDQTRTVTMTVQGQVTDEGLYRLTGELPVTMSDYGIDPPTAMLGTMKTGDDVTVHFDVVVAPAKDS